MGSFEDGPYLLSRDGHTIHHSVQEFGTDWQVKTDIDGALFHTPSPYPNECHNLPTTTGTTIVNEMGQMR